MALHATLWFRAAAWARQAQARPDMSLLWSCCGTPVLGTQTQVESQGLHALHLATCSHCGAHWLGETALQGAVEWRPVSQREALSLRALHRPACKAARSRDADD